MSETLPDVPLTATVYTSLNAATGIPIGTRMEVQHKGGSWVYLVESETTPTISRDGVTLTDIFGESSSKTILKDSLEVWAIVAAPAPREAKVNVQPF